MSRPDITYIVATYRRPEVLHATLRALCLQDTDSWEAVVVGDRCDERTEDAVRRIGDPRIRYYNLPTRYGEQGGPNSVGMLVADGQWLAFLNHDDLLLPDHTRHVLGVAERHDADVVSTRFASITQLHGITSTGLDAEFRPVAPTVEHRREIIGRPKYALEPASAWVIRRDTALAAGPWRSWQSMHRVPWHDWLIRLLTSGTRWHFDRSITGLCVLTHHSAEGLRYDAPGDAHRQLLEAIASTPVDELRRLLVAAGALATPSAATGVRHAVEQTMGLGLLRLTGRDYVEIWRTVRRRDAAATARSALELRTGETTVQPELLPRYLADPEALRVL